MEESDNIKDESTSNRGQKNIPTNLPEMIDTFISGKITAEELEILKAKKKKLRREKRKK